MPLYTYRWQVAHHALGAVAGRTTGASVRDALTQAMTTHLADGQRVGDALEAPAQMLERACDGHATEVAFKHADVLVSMVQLEAAEAPASVIVRDGRERASRKC